MPTNAYPALKGIGTDIIEIDRIRKTYSRYGIRFARRMLTAAEYAYCCSHADPSTHIAGRFAAKEAIAKALGTGIGLHLSWLDMEINRNDLGQPIVQLTVKAQNHFNHPQIMLSISHCKEYATATALWTGF
jgi:holo-[acyl-carrier protein] synthase